MVGGPLWTPREDAVMRRMWADGASCTKIAKALGRPKGSVVSRRPQLGLPPRGEARGGRGGKQTAHPERCLPNVAKAIAKRSRENNNPSGMTAARLAAAKAQGGRSKAPDPLPDMPAVAAPVSIVQLGHAACRYIGERPAVLMMDTPIYCGARTDGGSWCPEHRALVFQPRK